MTFQTPAPNPALAWGSENSKVIVQGVAIGVVGTPVLYFSQNIFQGHDIGCFLVSLFTQVTFQKDQGRLSLSRVKIVEG